MKYEVKPLKPFEKFYKKRTKVEKEMINEKLEILKENPYDYKNLDIKKLKSYENRYRLRVRDYRILYEVYDELLLILAIDGGSRGDIYK